MPTCHPQISMTNVDVPYIDPYIDVVYVPHIDTVYVPYIDRYRAVWDPNARCAVYWIMDKKKSDTENMDFVEGS